ncbi:glycosyltransferase family 2 protein [Cereibacter sphaeroides]|uniref:glycosyltransferase family 2 protein n=1 Tax=Cereibacter sphaeroides TaxID=1063 RepID=UPI001F1E7CFF|nr:glycosyltransferase family 2 protein [Cereibacter sphaeroides]MCE6959241.1 glycosyltransferase family 2 protein [Cereibacter sphaeroides]MCE6972044.1 glycosyltransferase family 2 protein [Cereibacter sphaeroides]
MKPFFSIVIPCFNRPEELRRTLLSCLGQDFGDYEVLVVDDGSTEDVESVVREMADPRCLCLRQANAGACAARNRGIDAARGDWIAFLDSDDTFLPGKLRACAQRIAELAEEPRDLPGMIFHLIEIDRGAGRNWRQPERMPQPGETMAEFLFCGHQHIMTSAMVVRADVARLVRFDEGLPMNQDIDFKVRLDHLGYRSEGIDEILGWYDDRSSVGRVSRGRHAQALSAWISRARPWMSDKAWYAYRANVLSVHLAPLHPFRTLGDFWLGWLRGGVPAKTILRRMIRAYLPGFYGRLTLLWLRIRGTASGSGR